MPQEDRSPTSVAARAVVATKATREAVEEALEEVPPWRVRRRAELKESLARARQREKTLLSQLGGTPEED
jgi:hypothetical protein